MKYIADGNGYLKEVSFGCSVVCDGKTCVEYTGTVPSGYSTLEEWYRQECDKLCKWYISNGNLVKNDAVSPVANKTDVIIDYGTTGKWTWRKWSSGKKECWAVFEKSSVTLSSWGSIYYGTWMNTTESKNERAYPFTFSQEPSVSVTPSGGDNDFGIFISVANRGGDAYTHAPAFYVWRPSSSTVNNPRIAYYVVGV